MASGRRAQAEEGETMTDPEWEAMLVERVGMHIGELFRELASVALIVTTWQEAEEASGQLAKEYAERIVRDLLSQVNEGMKPADHVHTGWCNHGTCEE
jgi:ATP-dependent protease HslVU (ClpYQ) ATPase subunit